MKHSGGDIAEIGPHGHGTAYLSDDVYIGQFNEDNAFHGHGTYRFCNDDRALGTGRLDFAQQG